MLKMKRTTGCNSAIASIRRCLGGPCADCSASSRSASLGLPPPSHLCGLKSPVNWPGDLLRADYAKAGLAIDGETVRLQLNPEPLIRKSPNAISTPRLQFAARLSGSLPRDIAAAEILATRGSSRRFLIAATSENRRHLRTRFIEPRPVWQTSFFLQLYWRTWHHSTCARRRATILRLRLA